MNLLTSIHLAGGSAVMLAGAVAASARKGGRLHARAGNWFFGSMLLLGATASILSALKVPPGSVLTGIFTCYFAATSWVTARRHDGATGRFEMIACAFALGAAALTAWHGFTAVESPTPVGRGPVFALAFVYGLAGLGDLRAVLRGKLSATQRISRHLWRMCIAFFIATGSFFLGQQKVMPMAVRGSPVLFVLAFAPLALMLFWLVWLRIGRRVRGLLTALDRRAETAPAGRDAQLVEPGIWNAAHWWRSASTGATRAARQAGTALASAPVASNASATAPSTIGSRGPTP